MDLSPALTMLGPGIAYSRLLRLKSGQDITLPSMEVECDLCASWSMQSPTSFVFEMRDGVSWQDIEPVNGRMVDANDIVFSYRRQRDPALSNSPLLRGIEHIEALDERTLRISLVTPDADALLALADGHSKIVAREAVEVAGDLRGGPTVGSGAWTLDSTGDDAHRFSRNPDYYEQGLPLLDSLNIFILPNEETRGAAFQTGLTDVHWMGASEWATYSERVPNAPRAFVPRQSGGVEIAFETSSPPFDDITVRRAALMAMDPLRAVDEIWGGIGSVGFGFPVKSADWLLPESEISKYFDSPNEAERMLDAAEYDNPIPVTVTVGDYGESYLSHAHAISVELGAVGFDTTVDIVSRREFGEHVWFGGGYEMMLGPTPPISVPNGYLMTVLHSDGVWNATGHSDAELDALLEAQAVETDAQARAKTVRRIQERMLDRAYRFVARTGQDVWVWNERVRDLYPNPAASEYHYWSSVWMER